MRRHSKSLLKALAAEGIASGDDVVDGCEVGVWMGELSADILEALPGLHLTMVDRFEPCEWLRNGAVFNMTDPEDWLYVMRTAVRRTIFAKDRRTLMVSDSEEATRHLEFGCFDFVFVDADHAYEGVKKDIATWAPYVRHGGILAGHDYNGKGDQRGQFGVKRAVDEFFASRPGLTFHTAPALVWWTKIDD